MTLHIPAVISPSIAKHKIGDTLWCIHHGQLQEAILRGGAMSPPCFIVELIPQGFIRHVQIKNVFSDYKTANYFLLRRLKKQQKLLTTQLHNLKKRITKTETSIPLK